MNNAPNDARDMADDELRNDPDAFTAQDEAPDRSAQSISGLAAMARMPNRTDAEVMISVEDQGEMSLAEFFAKHVPEDSNEGEDRRMAIRHAMDGEYVFEDADGDLTLLVVKRTMLYSTDKQRQCQIFLR